MTAVAGAVRFDAQGLIPAVVQEATTGEVLMVAWMNAEALERTLATRSTHFWSRSRQALWQKGETSGHRQHVEAVSVPVIASGGVGTLGHLHDGLVRGKADAVLAASIFHFAEHTVPEAKQYLRTRGVPIRLEEAA